MAPPLIAVLGVPALLDALRASGWTELFDSTDEQEVRDRVRKMPAEQRAIVVVRATDDEAVRSWVGLHTPNRNRRVLVAQGQDDPDMDLPQTRTVRLPATLDEVMASVGAPPRPAGGDAIVDVPGPEPEPADEDDWGDWGTDEPTPPPSPEQPAPEPPAAPWDAEPAQQGAPEWQPSPPSYSGAAIRDTWDEPVGTPRPVASAARLPEPEPEPAPWPTPPQQPAAPWDATPTQQVPAPVATPPAPPAPWDAAPPTRPTGQPPAQAWDPYHQESPQSFQQRQPDTGLEIVEEPPAIFGNVVRHSGRTNPDEKCPVVVVWASKGGVGKTTTSLALVAEAAANMDPTIRPGGVESPPRVVVVDMNRGQGDIRKYLRLSQDHSLPTIYDAAIRGLPATAIINPTALNQARPDGLPELNFGVVLAPKQGQADPSIVTSEFYRAVIDFCRTKFDLVVVDTQIIEDVDNSGLIDRVAIPLAASRKGWALGVTDSSMPGVTNARDNASKFIEGGVDPGHMMFYTNRAEQVSTLDLDAFSRALHGIAAFMGQVPSDDDVFVSVERGHLPNEVPDMGRLVSAVLYRILGQPGLNPARYDTGEKKSGGLFSRLFGRR